MKRANGSFMFSINDSDKEYDVESIKQRRNKREEILTPFRDVGRRVLNGKTTSM
jgi:uncharacterized protein YaaQ